MNIQIKLHYVTLVQILLLIYINSTDGCVYNANLNVIADGGEPVLETKARVAAGNLS